MKVALASGAMFLDKQKCSLLKVIFIQQNNVLQRCDLLLQDVVASVLYKYQPVIDTTVPWVYTTSALLTHISDDTLNIKAVIKPFQWPV